VGDVDHFHFLVPERHDLANGRQGERLESAGDGDFPVEHVGGQHLGGETFLIELLAQFELLDVVEKFDHFFVRSVAEGAKESGGEEFAAAFAAIEVDVKQIAGVELDLDPEPRSGMIRKL
jgi:hypothetical protein